MTQQAAPLVLGFWGAILSTLLAGIKVWEIWRERVRLTTSYSFSAPDSGNNEIIIENPSDTPVMISYWELIWSKRRFPSLKATDGRFPNEGYCHITIGAHDRYTLQFSGRDHFDWGARVADKGKIYLRLYVTGRKRPVILEVYPKK